MNLLIVALRRASTWRVLLAIVVSACLGAPVSAVEANQRWLRVSTAEFTVLTSLPEREAVAWAGEFSQFVAALQGVFRVNPRRLPPLTILVFSRERDFKGFRPLLPNGTAANVAGFFSRRETWSVAGLSAEDLDGESRRVIYHEGTHWFLSALEYPNPVWLEEGLSEVFSTFAIEGKHTVFGRAIEWHVEMLRSRPKLPLSRLLFLAQDGLHGSGRSAQRQAEVAYAQSWAFVHYLVFGQRDVPKGAMIDYVEKLRSRSPDDAFVESFGGSYAEVERKLARYLEAGRYYVARQPLKSLPPPKVQPVSPPDLHEALVRLRIAAGRTKEAREDLGRLLAAAPDDPRAYLLLGEIERESGNPAAAVAAYQHALDKGSQDFRVFYEIGAAAHAEAAGSGGAPSPLTPERARLIANYYERAINAHPRFPQSYRALAQLMDVVPLGNPEDASFLQLGLKLYPNDGYIRLGLATLVQRNGDAAQARSLVQQVLEDPASDTVTLAHARRLVDSWDNRDADQKVSALVAEKRFSEAIALLDAQIAGGVTFAVHQRLRVQRDQLQVSLWLDEARTAANEARWADAEERLTAVIESNASPILKSQVRRQLESVQRQKSKSRPAGKALAPEPDR